jgi:hypothetical protein
MARSVFQPFTDRCHLEPVAGAVNEGEDALGETGTGVVADLPCQRSNRNVWQIRAQITLPVERREIQMQLTEPLAQTRQDRVDVERPH